MPETAHSTAEADVAVRRMRDERRAQAASLLPSIVERVRNRLTKAGLRHDVFLIVPSSGAALITFGTTAEPDPSDDEWRPLRGWCAAPSRTSWVSSVS
jgi:hypothetical protein